MTGSQSSKHSQEVRHEHVERNHGVGRHPQGSVPGRRRRRHAVASAPPTFVGSPVTNAVCDPRDGAVYASLDHGHFGVHLHRSDDGGETWVEIAAPGVPAQAGGRAARQPDVAEGGRVGDAARLDDRAGPSRRAGRAVVRHDPGWAVPFGRPGRLVAVRRRLLEPAGARASGSAAATTMPASTRSASTRDGAGMSSSACRAAERGAPRTVARAGRSPPTACGPTSCRPSSTGDPDTQDPHRLSRCADRARRALVPASLRDLPHHRQRRQVGRDRAGRARRRSGSPSPPILTTRSPPGSCRRSATRCACRSTAGWS